MNVNRSAPCVLITSLVLGTSACGSDATITVQGDVTFTRVATTLEHLEKYPTYSGDDVFLRDDGSCTGSGRSVRGGSAVTVMDDKGAVVGVGALAETGRGHRAKAAGAGGLSTNETTTCVVTFSIPKVPARPFYKVQLAHLDPVIVQGDTASAVHLTV